KGIPLIGFNGEFQINFMIPEYFGIGKSVSRGFGVARRCSL
ncbi:MAG: CRISPR-associated endonuclease Cas6, partial [Euryarchaeota archaeon]|nr:CRISPR-associated endonuclease Cas6 [Euryarchaeota archaeon]